MSFNFSTPCPENCRMLPYRPIIHGGADEEVDDNGVPIVQSVGDDGRVVYKKIERRPMPKPVVTLKTRFKPNKQLKIGPLLDRMKASRHGTSVAGTSPASSGWLHASSSTPTTTSNTSVGDDDNDDVIVVGASMSPVVTDNLDAEIRLFLIGIDLATVDFETVTFRDMRQRFESRRGKELPKPMHRRFLNLAREAVERVTCDSGDVRIVEDPFLGTTPSHHSTTTTATTIATANFNHVALNVTSSPERPVECPLCLREFPKYAIEVHASTCSA